MKSVKSAPSSKEPVLHLKGTQAFITKYSPVGSSVGIGALPDSSLFFCNVSLYLFVFPVECLENSEN